MSRRNWQISRISLNIINNNVVCTKETVNHLTRWIHFFTIHILCRNSWIIFTSNDNFFSHYLPVFNLCIFFFLFQTFIGNTKFKIENKFLESLVQCQINSFHIQKITFNYFIHAYNTIVLVFSYCRPWIIKKKRYNIITQLFLNTNINEITNKMYHYRVFSYI